MNGRILTLIAVLSVAGCQKSSDRGVGTDTVGVAGAPKTTYACTDGSTVEAWYPTTDSARILHKGDTVELTVAISASGARYVGGGWQWWTKGMTEGTLSPLAAGEDIASSPGVTCTAR